MKCNNLGFCLQSLKSTLNLLSWSYWQFCLFHCFSEINVRAKMPLLFVRARRCGSVRIKVNLIFPLAITLLRQKNLCCIQNHFVWIHALVDCLKISQSTSFHDNFVVSWSGSEKTAIKKNVFYKLCFAYILSRGGPRQSEPRGVSRTFKSL